MNEKKLYISLSIIDELQSPFVNSYSEETINNKPISFSFSFKNYNLESTIYLKLINAINEFDDGYSKWIMHKNYSRKNYTIEPLLYYYLRSKFRIINSEEMKIYTGESILSFNKKLIHDLDKISKIIENVANL